MAKFSSAAEAYWFAYRELQASRSPKPNNFEYSEGVYGAPKEYRRLDAIAVMARAEACDPGNHVHPSFFKDYFLPEPTEPPPPWTYRELEQLNRALPEFECLLCLIGFVPKCGEKCHRKKG